MTTDKIRLRIYIAVFAFLLFWGTLGFKFTENLSLGDAAYFSIVTMATVGYGDIHPQTALGKILAVVLIVGGVGTFLGVVASFTDLFVERREKAIQQQKMNMINGLFFSELGNGLLKRSAKLDPEKNALFMILRMYKLLILEWIRHMDYLKNNYQYLFSLAVRLNPFDPEASAVIKDS